MHDILEEKFGAFECEIGDVELQWNNIKKSVVDTTSDLLLKVERGGWGQESCELRRKCSVKWIKDGSGRMSETKVGRKSNRKEVNFCSPHGVTELSLFKLLFVYIFF